MFTGIIEEIGQVHQAIFDGSSSKISIYAQTILEDTRPGDSIAVNGVCLTVISLSEGEFTADVMPETLRKSNLGRLHSSDSVNLERAVAIDGRLGGHFVLGHIDDTGVICKMEKEKNAVWITIKASPEVMELIVEKGSIAVDGVSLTVANVENYKFQVSIVPHTGQQTTLLEKRTGDVVNLENDIVGKYVKKLFYLKANEPLGGITFDFLKQNGF
ncbi:riboflavin synthase [Clostridium sp. MT-14]|jgi:riboflavin synthase|uniref:Riboflavin synthase n=1 Tax=Clostridium aromativorans TaxID=2836848 RepID=A0ABS8N9K1_9CLOT|nr:MULTISPECIES: riboflavin synthase [Clostridium]KAA8666471.1 riboflavin synthase [Clostridium sp. HV4-5-A1G]MCC9296484.1 riboflavin synthase [Clostridium aromativorans]CAB1262781.1 riboflavin synthase (alpha subunit) [Clostridiaceae bacterium BL-3]